MNILSQTGYSEANYRRFRKMSSKKSIKGCRTKVGKDEGPDQNKPCTFPFNDRGISHSKCTKGVSGGQLWCPTEVDEKGYYIDGKWGNCGKNCGNTSFISLRSSFSVLNFGSCPI